MSAAYHRIRRTHSSRTVCYLPGMTSNISTPSWRDGRAESDEADVGPLLLRVHPGESWAVLLGNTEVMAGDDGGRDGALEAARELLAYDVDLGRALADWKAASSGKSHYRKRHGYVLLAGPRRGGAWYLVLNSETDRRVASGHAAHEVAARVAAFAEVEQLPVLQGVRPKPQEAPTPAEPVRPVNLVARRHEAFKRPAEPAAPPARAFKPRSAAQLRVAQRIPHPSKQAL